MCHRTLCGADLAPGGDIMVAHALPSPLFHSYGTPLISIVTGSSACPSQCTVLVLFIPGHWYGFSVFKTFLERSGGLFLSEVYSFIKPILDIPW